MAVDPQYRAVGWVLPGPGVTPRLLPVVRASTGLSTWAMRPAAGVSVQEESGDGARVRIYRPPVVAAPAAMLWMHGGGLVLGRPEMDDLRVSGYAAALGITVVSVRYRLAPEHPFPAALEDCEAAWRWLQSNAARLGLDPGRVVVGGNSAGAGLAAALVQRLHDAGGRQPAGQLLVYPMLDDRTGADPEQDSVRHLVWTALSNRTGWSSYLGGPPGGDEVPAYAVPARRSDLSGLPPAWIGVGSADLFVDECRSYAARLQEAGVPTDLVVVDGAPHAFDAVAAARPSQDFLASQLEFLSERLDLPPDLPIAGVSPPGWIETAPISVEQSVEVAAPPSAVWPWIADHAGWPRWFAGASRVVVTGRGAGVGGRRRVRAGPLRFDEVFTAWEPGRCFAFAVTSSTLPILARMAESVGLEPTATGTRVTYRVGMQARRGFDRPLRVLAERLSRTLRTSLDQLKDQVEETPGSLLSYRF